MLHLVYVGGALGMMFIVAGHGHDEQCSIVFLKTLNEADYISLSAYIFGKFMNPSIIPPALG